MKTQTIYGAIRDGGDGSATIVWFKNKATVDKRLEDDEDYNMNEGRAKTLTFPADLDLVACGFRFID